MRVHSLAIAAMRAAHFGRLKTAHDLSMIGRLAFWGSKGCGKGLTENPWEVGRKD